MVLPLYAGLTVKYGPMPTSPSFSGMAELDLPGILPQCFAPVRSIQCALPELCARTIESVD